MSSLDIVSCLVEDEDEIDPRAELQRMMGDPNFPVPDVYANPFLRQYLETALWSSNDYSDESGGDPMDKNYSIEDIALGTLSKAYQDCKRFQAENAADLEHGTSEQAGSDFWLTRNHHGSGFWDGDWPDDVGERLTKAAHAFGQVDLEVGDDGEIHSMQG